MWFAHRCSILLLIALYLSFSVSYNFLISHPCFLIPQSVHFLVDLFEIRFRDIQLSVLLIPDMLHFLSICSLFDSLVSCCKPVFLTTQTSALLAVAKNSSHAKKGLY